MKHAIDTVGQWYLLEDTQERFQVIEGDELSGTIRIQWFDGNLDEIELETWRALSPVPVDPPDDWTGPLDLEASALEEWADEAQDSAQLLRTIANPGRTSCGRKKSVWMQSRRQRIGKHQTGDRGVRHCAVIRLAEQSASTASDRVVRWQTWRRVRRPDRLQRTRAANWLSI